MIPLNTISFGTHPNIQPRLIGNKVYGILDESLGLIAYDLTRLRKIKIPIGRDTTMPLIENNEFIYFDSIGHMKKVTMNAENSILTIDSGTSIPYSVQGTTRLVMTECDYLFMVSINDEGTGLTLFRIDPDPEVTSINIQGSKISIVPSFRDILINVDGKLYRIDEGELVQLGEVGENIIVLYDGPNELSICDLDNMEPKVLLSSREHDEGDRYETIIRISVRLSNPVYLVDRR